MLVEYKTINESSQATIIEKKSKFIASVSPAQSSEEAEEFIEKVRKEHWNATHNVPAYIIGTNQEIQKFSDDNEPSGTAGLPILEILKNLELVNVVVVVTRYFGGTLLGRGGLIRAYGAAAKEGLLAAQIVRMVPAVKVLVSVDYSLSGKIQNELISAGITISDTEYQADVTFHLNLRYGQESEVEAIIREITSDNYNWTSGEHVYTKVRV